MGLEFCGTIRLGAWRFASPGFRDITGIWSLGTSGLDASGTGVSLIGRRPASLEAFRIGGL